MGSLRINTHAEGNRVTLELIGQVDRDLDFSQIDTSKSDELVFDMKGIKSINSCGIREWINWMASVKSAKKISYKNCPKILIDQINMVAGFLPDNGRVESFYVPYYSTSTGEEKNVLFTYGKEFNDTEVLPPEKVLDSKGKEMEMDVIEAKYFKFLVR